MRRFIRALWNKHFKCCDLYLRGVMYAESQFGSCINIRYKHDFGTDAFEAGFADYLRLRTQRDFESKHLGKK